MSTTLDTTKAEEGTGEHWRSVNKVPVAGKEVKVTFPRVPVVTKVVKRNYLDC